MAFLYSTPKALVVSAIILALAMMGAAGIVAGGRSSDRYELAGTQSTVFRLDRFTGAVTACTYIPEEGRAAAEARIGLIAHCDVPIPKNAKGQDRTGS